MVVLLSKNQNNLVKIFESLDEKYLKQDLYNQIGISILISQISIKFFLKQKYRELIKISSKIQVNASSKIRTL